MTDNDSTTPIGLAFSGGAMLGPAHIGVLRLLEEEGVDVGWIAGTSAGAIVGAAYAFGMSCDELEDMSRDLSWLNVADIRPSRLGLLSNGRLESYLRDTLGDVKLEDAKIPLAVVATDILSGEKRILREGDLALAVAASASIPGIFSPIDWEGHMLVDGGISENLPVDTVRSIGAERVIGVDLYTQGMYPEPKNIFDVVINATSILIKNTRRAQPNARTVIIMPQLNVVNAADSSQVTELIEKGYRCGQAHIDEIRDLVG